MKKTTLEVLSNRPLNPLVYEIVFGGDHLASAAGQFIDLEVAGCYLKRPFSVADCRDGKLTVLYKVIGAGTREMTKLVPGDKAQAFIALGNGFDLSFATRPLLIGGGIGAAPLYMLAEEFAARGIRPKALLAFRCAEEAYFIDRFSALCDVTVCTDNGSLGYHGNALEALKFYKTDYDCYYACGPLPMLKALSAYSQQGQISMEARMGCGFGACMGCSIMTTNGPKRVCKEGPVFAAGEVVFG